MLSLASVATAAMVAEKSLLAIGIDVRAEELDARLAPQKDEFWGFYRSADVGKGLPRVLLIGDSIVYGYRRTVEAELKGKAAVDRWVTKLGEAAPELHELLRKVLANGPYDVIHFNIGLHWWQDKVTEEQYEPLMRKYVAVLREGAPKSKLIFALSTPVATRGKDGKLCPRFNPTVVAHNAIAVKIMAENKIDVDDLYSLMIDKLGLTAGDQWHWTNPGREIEGKAVAAAILVRIQPPAVRSGQPREAEVSKWE